MTQVRFSIVSIMGLSILALPGCKAIQHKQAYSPAGAGCGVVLVSKGKAQAVVVIRPDASPTEKFAASELIRYIKIASAAELPLHADGQLPHGPAILVGESTAVDTLGVKVETDLDGPDPYVIRVSANTVVLLGQGDRGTIYAVYDFLQSVVGCRFVAPGPIGDIVPRRATIAAGKMNRLEVPAFRFRIGWTGHWTEDGNEPPNTKTMVAHADWATKHRLHILSGDNDQMRKRGGAVHGSMNHVFDRLVSPKEYGDSHPEYFALINGKRETTRMSQPCTTNPDVIDIATKNLLKYLREKPNSDFVSLCPNDNFNWCLCERCKSLDTGEVFRKARTKGKYWESPVVSDRAWTFVNTLAERANREFPNARFYIFAYNNYLYPPRNVKPHKNIYASLCHMSPACYAHAITDPECSENQDFAKVIREWTRVHDRLFFYAYPTKSMWAQNPWPIARNLARNIEHLASTKAFTGFYSQAMTNMWGQLGQNHYVMAQKLWNPEANTEAILEDYFHSAFGPAGDAMKAFYDRLENAFTAPSVFVHHLAHLESRQFLKPDVIGDCRDYLAESLRLAKGDENTTERIARVKAVFDYALLFLEITLEVEAYRKDKNEDHLESAASKHQQLATLVRDFANRDTFNVPLAKRSTIAPTGRFRRMYYYNKWKEMFEYASRK